MKTIIVKTQKELDELPDDTKAEIVINGDIYSFNKIFKNGVVSVHGGTIQYVHGGTIQYVYGGTIQYVYGGTIQYVYGGTIQSVYGGTIQSVSGNALLQIYTDYIFPKVNKNAIIIANDCKVKIIKKAKTVQIIKNTRAVYDEEDFVAEYANQVDGQSIILYKSVNPETLCDFYTGKIKYEGVVTCPDWNPDKNIQCGNGLHLSPTPEMALNYNNGKVLKCKVALKDIVVYATDISKVRCHKVTVIGEL